MKQPLVSVIVPVYNVEAYLAASLESLEKQTYKNLEIILIDDGSTDGGGAMLDDFAKKHKNAKAIHQKNKGLSAARNLGLEKMTGDYVCFLDSDDFLADDAIECMVDAMSKHKVDMVVCTHTERKEDGTLNDFNKGALESGLYEVEEMIGDFLNEKGSNLQVIGRLFPKKFFDKVRFPVGEVYEDVAVFAPLMLQCRTKVAFVAEPKYYYNLRANSITHADYNPRKNILIKHTDEMCDMIDKKFPNLADYTHLRRLHARFSILRMVGQVKKKRSKEKILMSGLRSYILKHAGWILQNPKATRRDKIALLCLTLGNGFYAFAWRVYERRK